MILVPHAEIVPRIGAALGAWFDHLLCGPWDESHQAAVRAMASDLVERGLTVRELVSIVSTARHTLARSLESDTAVAALHKLLDADLTIMLDACTGLSDIADGLAHQIRTPLNVIRLNLALAERQMRSEPLDVVAIRELLACADLEVGWLGRLVRDFVDYASPAPLRPQPAELGASAEAVVALLRAEAEGLGVEVSLVPAAPVALVYDEERLKEALRRVLQNAVEASRPGGRVQMRVADETHGVRIEIDDEGDTLPEVGLRLFAPFYTTRPGRAGLGLAVVARTVAAHGGTIELQRRGGVTRFAITLPREVAS